MSGGGLSGKNEDFSNSLLVKEIEKEEIKRAAIELKVIKKKGFR